MSILSDISSPEEISRDGADAMLQPGGSDVFLRDRFDRRQIIAGAREMRMALGDFDAEQVCCATDITNGS